MPAESAVESGRGCAARNRRRGWSVWRRQGVGTGAELRHSHLRRRSTRPSESSRTPSAFGKRGRGGLGNGLLASGSTSKSRRLGRLLCGRAKSRRRGGSRLHHHPLARQRQTVSGTDRAALALGRQNRR